MKRFFSSIPTPVVLLFELLSALSTAFALYVVLAGWGPVRHAAAASEAVGDYETLAPVADNTFVVAKHAPQYLLYAESEPAAAVTVPVSDDTFGAREVAPYLFEAEKAKANPKSKIENPKSTEVAQCENGRCNRPAGQAPKKAPAPRRRLAKHAAHHEGSAHGGRFEGKPARRFVGRLLFGRRAARGC